jgi:phosphatidylserine/phosphatidylglycerophosphate/cardiolipin synthase-like enzyme
MPVNEVQGTSGALSVKLRRGERMCLIGMNVEPEPAPDFVGFAIEVQSPGAPKFEWLRNRLAFDYPVGTTLTGNRLYDTSQAPLQTFRWIHFPYHPKSGEYTYRVTMMHMAAGVLRAGDQATVGIELFDETVPGLVDVGFTRNFASSQAFADTFPDKEARKLILPDKPKDGLSLDKSKAPAGVYQWLGGKATELLFAIVAEAVQDPALTLDLLAYDLNEPDLVASLETVARRGAAGVPSLKIVIDDSDDHGKADSAETQAANRFIAAGAEVHRHHFDGLQHNKVIIVKRDGVAERVICGSTNFSFRGLYIQANNMLLFKAPEAVSLFSQMFTLACVGPKALENDALSKIWHAVTAPDASTVRICFSPHPGSSSVSLTPLEGAIEQATSSVFYSVAFLNQDTKGPIRKALDRLVDKPLFSYGVVNRKSGLKLVKPDGSDGVVDFKYLGAHAPTPFKEEWSGEAGINIHHKFVVTDFNLPSAKVFAGSSNLSFSGEEGNGDHLIQISNARVATAYAIEALRMFDHLHFRTKMDEAGVPKSGPAKPGKGVIKLAKPPGPGEKAWFEPFYIADSQKQRDRLLFSR